MKGILRKKGRRKVRRATKVEQVGVQDTPPKPTRIAPKGLEALEEMIDDCMTVAKQLDRDGLDDVIRLLRNARNQVVWKLGE